MSTLPHFAAVHERGGPSAEPAHRVHDLDGHYPTYLDELTGVLTVAADLLRPGGHLAVSAAVIRTGHVLTPLAWDLAHHLAARLTFRHIIDVQWDDPPDWLEADYCLLFEKPK